MKKSPLAYFVPPRDLFPQVLIKVLEMAQHRPEGNEEAAMLNKQRLRYGLYKQLFIMNIKKFV